MKRFGGVPAAIAGAVVTLAVLALPERAAAQSAAPATAVQRTVVKLGVSGRPDQAFLELALRRGYFEELGLDIQTVPATSGNEFVAPLAQNQIQVASGSPNAALFNALNRDIDIRIVADFAHLDNSDDGLVAIVARADLIDSGAVKSVADLRGRSIGAGNGRGQVANLTVYSLLKMNGMSMSDANVRSMNFPDALAALTTKSLDASFLIEPLVTQADRQNIARILIKGGAFAPGRHLSVLVYSPEFAKQTEAANKFMVAYLRGARDYYDAFVLKKDRAAAIAILTKYLPVKDSTIWESAMPQYTDLNGKVNVADIRSQAAIYKEMGDISGPVPDVEKFIDARFSAAATKVLGIR